MKKNHSSIKFVVAEELGEWMGIIIPIFFPQTQKFKFKFLHHKDHDGISMMTQLFEDEGINLKTFPTLKVAKQPARRHRLQLLKKYIDLTKKVDLRWKKKIDLTGRPDCFAHIFLDKHTTKEIYELAKQKHSSLTSFLLFHLDKIISSELLEKGSQRKWVMPLNMRLDPKQKLMGNHSASIIVNLDKNESEESVHKKMSTFLKDQIQWGSQMYSNMAKYIGKRGTKFVAKKIKDVGTGVFSNLGVWPQGIDASLPEYLQNQAWSVVAPASQVLPVAAAMIDWCGQISLTLQFHPSLKLSNEQVEELARKWIQSSLHELYQVRHFDLHLFTYQELNIP